MLIQIPPPGLYDVPEGTFQAVCIDAHEIVIRAYNPPRQMLSVMWELPGLTAKGIPCRICKKYHPYLNKTSVLGRDLRNWFGQDLVEGVFNSDVLIGKPATVTVKHWRKAGYDRVIRHVVKVEPPAIVQGPSHVVGGH